jgi:hypothetical protein
MTAAEVKAKSVAPESVLDVRPELNICSGRIALGAWWSHLPEPIDGMRQPILLPRFARE